jgi:hypothetical protein
MIHVLLDLTASVTVNSEAIRNQVVQEEIAPIAINASNILTIVVDASPMDAIGVRRMAPASTRPATNSMYSPNVGHLTILTKHVRPNPSPNRTPTPISFRIRSMTVNLGSST